MAEEPDIGMLTLVCVATGQEIDTGASYTRDDLARTRRAKLLLLCPFCRQSHLFNFSDARLKPAGESRQ
jgi:hypothetical protein